MLGGIIGGVIYNNSIQILDYIGILCILCVLVLTLKWIKQYNVKAKQLIDGKDETWLPKGTKKQGLQAYSDVFLGEHVDGKLILTAYP